jgi:hypothetical protein
MSCFGMALLVKRRVPWLATTAGPKVFNLDFQASAPMCPQRRLGVVGRLGEVIHH